jgi:hypothetical protein
MDGTLGVTTVNDARLLPVDDGHRISVLTATSGGSTTLRQTYMRYTTGCKEAMTEQHEPTTEREWRRYWRKYRRARRRLERIAYDNQGPWELINMENSILGIRR